MVRLLIVLPLVILGACSLTPARDEASPFYVPPAGSRLILN